MNILAGCETFRLSNNLRAVCLRRGAGSVAVQIFIGAGSMDEGALAGSGVAHFLEHMLFQGCEGYPLRSGPETIERHGGELNAFTSLDKMVITAKVLPKNLAETLAILSAMVRAPKIPARRFAAEKEVIKRECARYRDVAFNRLSEALFALNFPGHPLGLPIIGFPENLAQLRREDLAEYHSRNYSSANCVVVAVGDVESADFAELVERYFGSWRFHPVSPTPPPEKTNVFGKERTIVFADPHESLALGRPVPPITDPDSPRLDLMWSLLAGSPNSALSSKLELERTLALILRNSFTHYRSGGYGGIAALTTPDKFSALHRELFSELRRIVGVGFSARQLRAELTQRQGDWMNRFSNLDFLAGQLGNGMLLTDRADYADVYQQKLKTTTVEEVNAVLRGCNPENLNFCAQRNRIANGSRLRGRSMRETLEIDRFSGVKLVHWDASELPMAYGSIVLPGGAVFEKPEWRGVGSLFAALALCGTRRYSEKALLDKLDTLGAVLEFRPGANTMMIDFNAPRKNLKKLAALIGEILADFQFTPEQFEREKAHIAAQLRTRDQSPDALAAYRAKQLLLGAEHPYCGLASAAEVDKLTPDKVREYFRSIWRSGQIGVALAGLSANEVVPTLAQLLGGVKLLRGALRLAADPEFATGNIHRAFPLEREQLAVVRILPGVRLDNELTNRHIQALLSVENDLFSPLFQAVREDNALAYSVGMRDFGGWRRGGFMLYAQTAPGNGSQVEKLFADECAQLAKTGVSRKNFAEAIAKVAFAQATAGENPATMVEDLALKLHYRFTPRLPGELAEEISRLDYAENRRIVRAIFTDIPEIVVRAGAVE